MALDFSNVHFGSEGNEPALPEEMEPDLVLPNQLKRMPHVAVDIGGSLAKVVYNLPDPNGKGGRLHFKLFDTGRIGDCVEYLRKLLRVAPDAAEASSGDAPVIHTTGGGAFKFHDLLVKELKVEVRRHGEMECLVQGLNFLLREVPYEVFTYPDIGMSSGYTEKAPTSPERPKARMVFENTQCPAFPYLLVNIGSGVSILKVIDQTRFERVTGSSLGGGTFRGLLSALTGVTDYTEMLELACAGDAARADLLVRDIYGDRDDYEVLGLPPDITASSFGKLTRREVEAPGGGGGGADGATSSGVADGPDGGAPPSQIAPPRPQDMARALLDMLAFNIAQLAHLSAGALGIRRIYFGGCFLRGHPTPMHALSKAVGFWSGGQSKAYFLRHEGYLGAMGAFLHHDSSLSFYENFTRAMRATQSLTMPLCGVLDVAKGRLVPFPKLRAATDEYAYTPDTFVLSTPAAQRWWLDTLDVRTDKIVELAQRWHPGDEDMAARANTFAKLFRAHLHQLRIQPAAYGTLSIRSLLNLREQCLHEAGFDDLFREVKQTENELAEKALPSLLKSLDAIQDPVERFRQVITNVLTGNVFDWGCSTILESLVEGVLDFTNAASHVGRPDHANHVGELVHHFCNTSRPWKEAPYKKAVIFVDNSGADVLLGVLPFARFLLQLGMAVVIAANSVPAINDVTYSELVEVMQRVQATDLVIQSALAYRKLRILPSGSDSPCVDLARVDESLANEASDVDLVVLIGMGRAIHTNFHARFTCDSLKMAVLKDERTAEALGFRNFDGLVLWTRAREEPLC